MPDGGSPGITAPDGTVTVVTGNANVGRITGRIGTSIEHVGGDVHFGGHDRSGPDELRVIIEDLRRELERSHDRGDLDAITYRAAAAELAEADRYARTHGPDSRERLVVALRRFKGLIDTLAGLTAKVAAAISAVRGTR
jgi:hypothetical protein